jgi:LysR family transcriptional regulator, low CO2-responsive transcriptional regulator
MTLGQLRSLLEVAATGSVRAAAERLFVTQPAVSSQIAALQKELGVRLVTRDGRGLRLTTAGEVLSGYARRLLGLLEEAAVATTAAAEPERGRVRLAAVTTAGEQLLPRLIAGFRERHPAAEISLEVANRPRVFSLLEHHEADLVIGGRPPDPSPLHSLAERPNALVLVAPPGLLPRSPRPEELSRVTWLLREPGSGTRATTEEYLAATGLHPPTLTLGSNGAIREALVVGLGVTLLSLDAVGDELARGSLVEVRASGTPLRRAWHLVARGDEPLAATAQLFVEHLLDTGGFEVTPALTRGGEDGRRSGRYRRTGETAAAPGPARGDAVDRPGAPVPGTRRRAPLRQGAGSGRRDRQGAARRGAGDGVAQPAEPRPGDGGGDRERGAGALPG